MSKINFIIYFLKTLFRRFIKRVKASKFSFSARLKYFFLATILLVLIGAVIVSRREALFQPVLTEGVIGVYKQDNLPNLIGGLISEPLVKIDSSGKPVPNLIEGWEVNKESDLYIFKLKSNLIWSDGSKVLSSDIALSLSDVEISYPDNKTIQFKLADNFVPFPTLLTFPVFKKGTLIGLGKYRVVEVEKYRNILSKLTLVPVNFNSQDAKLLKIIVKFYPDEKTAKTAFELGEVDSLIGVSDDRELQNYPTADLKKFTNYNKLVGVFYNTKDPVLSDKNFRKALGYAISSNESSFLKTSLISNSWAFNNTIKESTNNKVLAKSYLDKVKNGKDSTITLTTTPALYLLGEKIVKDWREIGILSVLRVESGSPQNFQVLLTAQYIPQDPDQYALWHSTQTKTNISNFKSDRIDKDLEDGRKISDPKIRKERYLDFQKILTDESPATFLYFPKFNVLYRKKVEAGLNKVLQLQQGYFR